VNATERLNKTRQSPLQLDLFYEGSVKKVWQSEQDQDSLWFEFTDDYSVFDWGKMPDTIQNKGRALALMGAFFFLELNKPEFWRSLRQSQHLAKFDSQFLEQRFADPVYAGPHGLCASGLPSHFKSLTDKEGNHLSLSAASSHQGSLLMQVERAKIYRPTSRNVLHQTVFFYPQPEQSFGTRLIPLEVVFRFGMPGGSSLEARLAADKEYAHRLGFQTMPEPNTWFKQPVLEFFTKLEPKDRFLSVQEAAELSGLNESEFSQLTEIAQDVALALHELFARSGLELWDGKIELLARTSPVGGDRKGQPHEREGKKPQEQTEVEIILADSIGPDELRLLHKGQQLSKEMIRQFYRGSAWEKALKEAQTMAVSRGTVDWKEICLEELSSSPQPLSSEFKAAVDNLYGVLANAIISPAPFAEHPDIDSFSKQLLALNKK